MPALELSTPALLSLAFGGVMGSVMIPALMAARALMRRMLPLGGLPEVLLSFALAAGVLFVWARVLNLLSGVLLPLFDRYQHPSFMQAGLLLGFLGGAILTRRAIARAQARRPWPFVD